MKKRIAIIGGGTSSLFAASFLDPNLFEVTIYEKKSALGRKFLVAGDGGFNLTHNENITDFKARYTPISFLNNALSSFSNNDLRSWLLKIGIPTFVGTSNRVFPKKGIKPIEVLKSIERYLISQDVRFEFNKTFTGWDSEENLVFNDSEIVKSDYIIFALGGSSWKSTGSDGSWLKTFENKGFQTVPFKASNCAFKVNWTSNFINTNKGKPLKNIAISINSKTQKGEVVITEFGIEGNAIYGLSPEIQNELTCVGISKVSIDFKPTQSMEVVLKKLGASKYKLSKTLKEVIKLPKPGIDLIKDALSKEAFLDLPTLAQNIKSFPMEIFGSAPIEEAISTSGGIDLSAVNDSFELNKINNHYCIGEMLDWNAPTGGYLIQGCSSMGVYLAEQLNKLESNKFYN